MQKTFLSNLTLIMLLNLLIKPGYLLLVEAEVQNRVGAEVFGNYSALIGLSFLLNIFLDLGLNNFTSRTLAQNNHLVSTYISRIGGLKIILLFVYTLLLLLTGLALGYQGEDVTLLMWLGFNQFLAMGLLYLRANVGALLLFKYDSLLSVLDRSLLIIGLGSLLFFYRDENYFDIEWLVKGQTVAYATTLLVALLILRSKSPIRKLNWRPRVHISILKKSLPYALLILLSMIYYKTDVIMLERMLPKGDYFAGIYAKGFRIFEATNMLGFLFATLLLPIFSLLLKQQKSVSGIGRNAFRLMITGSAIIVAVSYSWPEFLLSLIYTEDILESKLVFTILMISFAFILLSYLWGTLMTANGNLRLLNIIAGTAALVNITLNLILIPKYQAVGSAFASLITQGLVTITQAVICYKLNLLRFPASLWVRTAVFLACIATLSYLFTIIPIGPEFKVLSYPVVGVLLAFAVGLLRLVDIRSIIQSRSKTR